MRIFSALYTKVLIWARHRLAPYYLAALSFSESSFFPIPPDVMLAPMVVAHRERAWHYAAITSICSALGGMLGYLIGALFFTLIHPYLIALGYESTYQQVEAWFHIWGFWLTFVCGLVPIPYKLFTIAAGATRIPFIPFVLGSIVGRSLRFFLVTALMVWGGERMKNALFRHIDRAGWILTGLLIAAIIYSLIKHWFG